MGREEELAGSRLFWTSKDQAEINSIQTSNKPLGKFTLSHTGRGASQGTGPGLLELMNSQLVLGVQLTVKMGSHMPSLWRTEVGS